MGAGPQSLVQTLLGRFASRLRFPQLFAFTLTLFLLDLLIPDFIPFMDELLLGLGTLLLGMWRKQEPPEIAHPPGAKPPVKDVTPRD